MRVNVCFPCVPSILLLSVAILTPRVSCSLSESLRFGMICFFFFNGHFELRLKLGLLPIACSQTRFLECRRPQRSPYLSVFLIPSSCGMARITSYRSRLRFQRPRKGTLPTMKSRSERVEKDYRTQTTEQGGRKPKSSKICLCKDKVVIHTREHPK